MVSAMLDLLTPGRAYPPEIVMSMSAAFDNVCRCMPAAISDDADMRRKLALIILRHVDGGERDAARLAELALQDFTGSDRCSIGIGLS